MKPAKPDLEEAINELLSILSRATTAEICGYVSALWMKQGPELARESGLSSPLTQTSYLLGLMTTVAEPPAEVSLSEDDWTRVILLLNAITDSYAEATMKRIVLGEVDPKKGYIATMAFLQWFMSGRLAVAEQLEALILELCAPFDKYIYDFCGISASRSLDIVRWLRDVLIDEWSKASEAASDLMSFQEKWIREAADKPERLAELRSTTDYRKASESAQSFYDWSRYPNCITEAKLVERFGEEPSRAFLKVFALSRGESAGFRYFASPNPPNPAETAPLFHLEGGRISAPLHAMLYNALYDRFDDILRNGALQERYFRLRGSYLEGRANSLIGRLFPNASLVLEKYYETAEAEFEHDGLILTDGNLIVLEEKAAEMKVPSRDAERAFRNLSDQFRSDRGIGHGFLQAMRVINALENSHEPVTFFEANGNQIAQIDPRDVRDSFVVCVTIESFGVLAIDPTLLLNVPEGARHPWITNLYDLETLLDGFEQKGLDGHGFIAYLRARRDYSGRLLSDDELNIAGRFLHERSLPAPTKGEIAFITDYADLFDDLYLAKHGVHRNSLRDAVPGGANLDLRASLTADQPIFVDSARKPISRIARKVGRNEPCPCGSGRKFKRCCSGL